MVESTTKSRPILFSGPMVRAILAGTKTSTRRIIRANYEGSPILPHQDRGGRWLIGGGLGTLRGCPYGNVGDTLLVRENFYVMPEIWEHGHGPQPIHYAADVAREQVEDYAMKPSIHMPRWACRLLLTITEVRVERLQDGGDRDFWGEEKWAANPWAWAVSFAVVENGKAGG